MPGSRFFKKVPEFRLPKFRIDEGEGYEALRAAQREHGSLLHPHAQPHPEYPGTDFKTVRSAFEYAVEKYSDRPFIMECRTRKGEFDTVTYGRFKYDVLCFATCLMYGKELHERRVIIIGENTYEWYVAYMALLMGAGIAVPIDAQLPENEIENLITRSKAEAIIYSPKLSGAVKKAVSRTSGIRYMIEMYSDDPLKEGHVGFDFLCERGVKLLARGSKRLANRKVEPDEFAALFFTSGTTSEAKGVMLSQRNLSANINAASAYVDIVPEDRLLSVLPLHHTYESSIGFLYPMAMGASIAINRSLKHFIDDMKLIRPTCMIAVPVLIETLHRRIEKALEKSGKKSFVDRLIRITGALPGQNAALKRKVFGEIYAGLGGKLRIIVSAAAPLDIRVSRWFKSIGITFMQGYGLTETAPIAALTPDYDMRDGSVGKAVKGVEIKIKDPNENGEGDVLIRGETLMLGYYENEKATKEAIVDGWFDSGDIGYMDQDGFVYLTGRSKNVIVTQNGKNIYPEEIETLLKTVPEIKECMVYGKEISGEKELIVTALIIPDYAAISTLHEEEAKKHGPEDVLVGDTPFTEEEISRILWAQVKTVNHMLSGYKAVKRIEIKHDEFAKTSTLKIKRFVEIEKGSAR